MNKGTNITNENIELSCGDANFGKDKRISIPDKIDKQMFCHRFARIFTDSPD